MQSIFFWRTLILLTLPLLFFLADTARAQAPLEKITKKNQVNIGIGFYRFSVTDASFLAPGLVQLSYRRHLHSVISVETDIDYGINSFSTLSSVYWGANIGAGFSILDAFKGVGQVGDIITIRNDSRFGAVASLGFGMRSVPLKTISTTYSGPYLALTPVYRLSDEFQLQGKMLMGWFRGSGTFVQTLTFSVGLGWLF